MSNAEWNELLAHVNDLIDEMDQLEDEVLRSRVFELLQGIDAIHREALTRLVRLFKEGVMEQVVTDPPIHTLMELYDLLPAPRQQPEDKRADRRFPNIPIKVEPMAAAQEQAPPPHWVPVLGPADTVAPGETRIVAADDREMLLCRVDDRYYALAPRCLRDAAPLTGARLSRYTLVCPVHQACYYDARSGARIGGEGSIDGYAVRVDDQGRVLIGIGVPFKPDLPAF